METELVRNLSNAKKDNSMTMRYSFLIIIPALYSAPCPAQHELATRDPGIIESVPDTRAYPCFDVYEGKPAQTQYVIDSESAYQRYKENFSKPCDFPEIDFEMHTLLGMYGGGNNYCDVEYFMHVENDKAHARYIFTLTVNQKGFCKMAVRWHWHWVLVPRLPESYEVEFKVNRVRDAVATPGNEKPKPASEIRPAPECKSITGYSSTPGESGISGKIVKGPTRPVNRDGDATDSYMPFQAGLIIKRARDKKQIARFNSDARGEFRVSLRPGTYIVEPLRADKKQWPRPDAPCPVTVKANTYVEIRIAYDTGIR